MYIIFIFIVILVCFIGIFVNTHTPFSYAQSSACKNLCPKPGPRGVQYNRYEDGTCEILCMDDLIDESEPVDSKGKPVSSCPTGQKLIGGKCVQPSNPGAPPASGGEKKCPPGEIIKAGKCVRQTNPGGLPGLGGPPGGEIQRVTVPPVIRVPGFDVSKCEGLGMDECANKLNIPKPFECPDGQIIQNKMCVNPQSTCVGGTVWDAKSKKCIAPPINCPPGRIMDPIRGCIVPGAPIYQQCPLGSMMKNGKCEVVSCSVVGQTVQNGQCVCPAGQMPKQGRCVAGGPSSCPSGQNLINGKCVVPPSSCPSGQNLINGKCSCPVGTFMRGNLCVSSGSGNQPCPVGQIRNASGQCVPRPVQPCPVGQIRNASGQCVSRPVQPCPVGQIRNASGQCVSRPVQPCPVGQIRNASGQCVPRPTGGGGIAARR
jgi:hypothetical protein